MSSVIAVKVSSTHVVAWPMKPTFSRVWEVCDSFGHDNGHVNTALNAVHTELDEDVVQKMFHNIPIAHDPRASLEGIANMSARCCIRITVLASKGEGLAQFSVAVLGHDGRDRESGLVLEGQACAY
jgi:hypothetical protein